MPVLWIALLFVGYHPGSSAVDDVIVTGRILTDDGRPLAHEAVDLLLPETYGLTAIEAQEPARFGNWTRIGHATTDVNGEFSHSLGLTVYHVDWFYIPFPIRIPRKPPALVFSLRVPRISPASYVIQAREGSYRVVSAEVPGTSTVRSLTVREEILGKGGAVSLKAVVELSYESSVRNSDSLVEEDEEESLRF